MPEIAEWFMVAQSIASRPRRPQQTDPDDVVLARALEFAGWARRNIRLIIGAGVVIVMLVGGLLWYRVDQSQRLERAAIEMLQLEQTLAMGDEAAGIRDLQLYVQRFSGTPYAEEARVTLGRLHLEQDQPAEAVQALRPVADRMERSPVGVQAALLMAAAQETAGEREAAIDTYLRVADRAPTLFQRQEGLMYAAFLREEAGDYAGAAELYRRLVQTEEPGSFNRSLFEMRLAEAEGRAAAR